MAGRKKQPLSVIEGKGRSNHLTNEEKEKRKKHEESIKAKTDKIEPPKRLLKSQKIKFEEISSQLVELNLMDNLDVDTLAMYIETYDNYVRVTRSARKMTTKQLDKDFKEFAARSRTATQLADTCRKLAGDLGLTISSRLKLVIPETEEKEDSPMSKFLNRRDGNG